MKLKDSQTYVNLANAFAGECQARTRYEFIEYGARMQGYEAIAQIVDTIAYQEFNHARMFYTALQKASDKPIENIDVNYGYSFREKWDLQQNFLLASKDEHEEAFEIYPTAAKIAEKEGFLDESNLFKRIANVEKRHEKIFEELYEQMKDKSLYKKPKAVTWKCPICGYEMRSDEAWQQCPVCKSPQGMAMLHLASLK